MPFRTTNLIVIDLNFNASRLIIYCTNFTNLIVRIFRL